MTVWSPERIARECVDVGWHGEEVVYAVAIALAESGGRTDAIGDRSLVTEKWGPSVGLFQIRSLKSEDHTGGVRDRYANTDPVTNTIHAHTIYRWARGFTPWSTIGNGTYKKYLLQARRAFEELSGGYALHRYLLERHPWQVGADVAACQSTVGCRADGVFGPITHEHVVEWQHRHRILADGIVGPQTARTFGWQWRGPRR